MVRKQERAYKQTESFRRMVAQLAWRTWRVLPRQHQIWISVGDLIEDGMFCLYQMISGEWYNKEKSSLSTSAFHVVRNYLFNEYILKYANQERFNSLESAGLAPKKNKKGYTPAGLVSLDAIPFVEREVILPPQLSTSEDTIIQNVMTDCYVIPVLGKIYREATSELQDAMIVWFLQNKGKNNTVDRKFRVVAKEFRMLSGDYKLTYFDCLHLLQSPLCLNKLSHEILSVPHDFNHPTPGADREL